MADTYWLTFRIHEDSGYAETYRELNDTIQTLTTGGKWWYETTAFYLFSSSSSIDAIARSVGSVIRLDRDLVVIGKTDYKTGRVVGKCEDDDIFDLVPFMKYA